MPLKWENKLTGKKGYFKKGKRDEKHRVTYKNKDKCVQMTGEHHVVPDPKGGWKVKRSNSDRSSGNFDKKQDAVNFGRELSKNQKTELVIHGKDGKIQRKDSHGNDPNPPKDRK